MPLAKFISSLNTYAEKRAVYNILMKGAPSPLGEIIHLNTHVPENEWTLHHGGCGLVWIPQAKKVHTLAQERGLFLADARTAAGYAKGFRYPIIATITPTIPPQTDKESGIGAHFQVPPDTPVAIRSIHAINLEYFEWLKKARETEIPRLLPILKEEFRKG